MAIALLRPASEDVAGLPADAPLIKAEERPIKVSPEAPGGLQAPNRDILVYERLQGTSAGKGARERLLPESEEPMTPPPPRAAETTSTPNATGTDSFASDVPGRTSLSVPPAPEAPARPPAEPDKRLGSAENQQAQGLALDDFPAAGRAGQDAFSARDAYPNQDRDCAGDRVIAGAVGEASERQRLSAAVALQPFGRRCEGAGRGSGTRTPISSARCLHRSPAPISVTGAPSTDYVPVRSRARRRRARSAIRWPLVGCPASLFGRAASVAERTPRAVIFGLGGLALSDEERRFFAEADPSASFCSRAIAGARSGSRSRG